MEPTTTSDSTASPKSKSHSRHPSNRYSLPRRSTIGPLDGEDPLGAGTSPASSSKEPPESIKVSSPPSSKRQSYRENPILSPKTLAKDFSYLQRPEIFHALDHLDLPLAFRKLSRQSDLSLPSSVLLRSSKFRSAAIAAANELCNGTLLSAPEIFSLFYTRLACLTLTDKIEFAAEESKAIEDLNSPFYRDEDTRTHLMPWELRVLAVRLQGIGYGDPRRAISGYYSLARDAREEITKASMEQEERLVWKERLEDLGLRVGNTLVETGDVSGAIRHFKSLRTSKTARNVEILTGRLALLYMRLGDVAAAKDCIEAVPTSDGSSNNRMHQGAILQPLLSMAEGRYDDAISEWKDLLATSPGSVIATQNLAVCLLYVGRIEETSTLLTSTLISPSSSSSPTTGGHHSFSSSFRALTFNLATVYELCSESEKAHMRKIRLTEIIAGNQRIVEQQEEEEEMARGRGGGGGGNYERLNSDFKL